MFHITKQNLYHKSQQNMKMSITYVLLNLLSVLLYCSQSKAVSILPLIKMVPIPTAAAPPPPAPLLGTANLQVDVALSPAAPQPGAQAVPQQPASSPVSLLKLFNLPKTLIEASESRENEEITLLNNDLNGSVAGVIINVKSGNSYDGLFTKIQQKSKQGTFVAVFQTSAEKIKNIFQALTENHEQNRNNLTQLIEYIEAVGKACPNCVIFNWECSSGYSSTRLKEGKANVMRMLKLIIDRGYMAMFSDFTLMALIRQWDAAYLGPNPFVRVGQISTAVELIFDPQQLKKSPSTQLQMVGLLSSNSSRVSVAVQGGTIVYSVNQSVDTSQFYQLKVLTIFKNASEGNQSLKLKGFGGAGYAGHVLLTYKSGAHILASMTHWAELMKIDTSEQKLFDVAADKFGEEFAKKLKQQMDKMDESQRGVFVKKTAIEFVQGQSPGTNLAYAGSQHGEEKETNLRSGNQD